MFDYNFKNTIFCINAFDNHYHDTSECSENHHARSILKCGLCVVNLCELLWVGVMPRVYSDNTLQQACFIRAQLRRRRTLPRRTRRCRRVTSTCIAVMNAMIIIGSGVAAQLL